MANWVTDLEPEAPDIIGAWRGIEAEQFLNIPSTNITPDSTGIPYYDESLFIEVLRTGHVKARRLSDLMPWWYYRQMTDEDLTAVLAYLRTLKPVRHIVDNSVQPTPCKLCRASHGKGEAN